MLLWPSPQIAGNNNRQLELEEVNRFQKEKNTVHIFLTSFEGPLKENLYTQYKSLLSSELQEKNERYMRWQDRHAHLFGKLLFIEALKTIGIQFNYWEYLKYNSHQRPCLTIAGYDVNISHSGNYVLCAMGKQIRVGIDIEKMKPLELDHFRSLMAPGQWEKIDRSDNRISEFYRYWTAMESVVKADGQGLAIPFETLKVVNGTVRCQQKLWHIKEVEIDVGYKATLATDVASQIELHKIDYYQPLNTMILP